MPRAVLILAWLSASSGCIVVDDPNHCWNLERDATCEELYPGSVCSRCARGYSGCVEPDAQTPASCLDSDAAATEPSSSATETASESGASECVGEGFTDACPTEAPYCAAGLCTGCQAAGGDDFCAAVDGALPQCHPTWDHCVECFDDTPCTGGSVCTTSFECGGCTEHEQCPDSACDLLTGACMEPDREIWVDDDAAICDEGSNGASAGNPVCSLVEAFTRVAP
ncbi:MAG: hypothetical protein IAG13_04490, partial [Deltaproteobacteria bacterium]|nr:hypothetical protein [Nannocystaceae bacterium]